MMMGPEFHNYNILNSMERLNPFEKRLFINSHNMIPLTDPSLVAELGSLDNMYSSLIRIEAAVGPVNKLNSIKRKVPWSWEDINNIVLENPIVLFRKPENLREVQFKTYVKLYSYGAAEALRVTAASIYYARVAATVSAKAFEIPLYNLRAEYDRDLNIKVGYTYEHCMNHILSLELPTPNFIYLYPYHKEFTELNRLSSISVDYKPRSELETRNLRLLQLSEVTVRIKNKLSTLFEIFWFKPDNRPIQSNEIRDWLNLKQVLPTIKDTLTETLDQYQGDYQQQVRSLVLTLLRVTGYSSKPMKAFCYGTSSRSYDQTMIILKQLNLYENFTSDIQVIPKTVVINARVFDEITYLYNYFILSLYSGLQPDLSNKIDIEVAKSYSRDNFISDSLKKKILTMLLYYDLVEDVSDWSKSTRTILSRWIKRQKLIDGFWIGEFNLQLQCSDTIMMVKGSSDRNGIRNITYHINNTKDEVILKDLFEKSCELLDQTTDVILNKLPKGPYIVTKDKIITSPTMVGVRMTTTNMENVNFTCKGFDITGHKLRLLDHFDNIIIQCPLGIIATEFRPPRNYLPDFKLNGVSFQSLVEIGSLSFDFSYEMISPVKLSKMLDDLKVEKPEVTNVTKQRLNLQDNWGTRDIESELKILEEEKEMKLQETKEINIEDFLLTDEEFEELKRSGLTIDVTDMHSAWLLPDIELNLITQGEVVQRRYQPQIIWERIIHAKEFIISRLCCNPDQLCRQTILALYGMTRDKDILHSLIFVYDRLYTNTETPSPTNVKVDLEGPFLSRFKLLDFNI